MKDIRIQIVNYKTKKYLISCLESLYKDLENSTLSYEVSVLDNDSEDDLSDLKNVFSDKTIEMVMNKSNVGFGEGHNILAKDKNCKYLLLLNPDTRLVEPSTVERLVSTLERMKCQVVGPRLITEKGETQMWDHGELRHWLARIAWIIRENYWKDRKKVTEVAWVSGAVFLIDKKVFDQAGQFDKNFFLYSEEVELCWRIRKMGFRIFYDPTIAVFHQGGVVADKSKYLKISREYFLKKDYGNRFYYRLILLLYKLFG